jgi:TolB-like protein/Tfp pilus assembly protein PilF
MINDKSVAVLPFVNRSMQAEDEYFTDGIHDELLTQLSRVSALKVISRTSVEKYRNTEKSLPEIARELSVATIVEGAVQRVGNQVRINAQLINAHTDEHLWAETFDREYSLDNLLAIQSEVTASIADALEAELTDAEKGRISRPPTSSLEAYDLYLHGRQLMATRRGGELQQALEAFEKAVEIDPNFAKAWVGIADASMLLIGTGGISISESREIRKRAIEKALALDDQLGEAYAALAILLQDKKASIVALEKAIELSPNNAQAYLRYASRIDEPPPYVNGMALLYKAAELDPLASIIQVNIAGTLAGIGRMDEALERLNRVLQYDPEFVIAYRAIASIQKRNGRLAEAVHSLREAERLDPNNGWLMASLAEVHIALGDLRAAEEVHERIAGRLGQGNSYWYSLEMTLRGLRTGWRESLMLDSIPPEMDGYGNIYPYRFLAYLAGKEFEAAHELLLRYEPGWADPDQWSQMIKDNRLFGGCVVAGILVRAGEEDLGKALLDQAAKYELETLPGLVEATDRFSFYVPGLCHLVSGDHAQALEFFEAQVSGGHYFDWPMVRLLPWWEPLRDDPRFTALEEQIESKAAEQRELLRQMDEDN